MERWFKYNFTEEQARKLMKLGYTPSHAAFFRKLLEDEGVI